MIRSVSIIGAGTMGGGIALTTIKAGLPTCVIDLSPEALARLDQRFDRHFVREIEKDRMDERQVQAARSCLTVSDDLAAAASSDLVIEAVFEDIAVKRDLLSRLQPLLPPEVMIATNTSCLLVSEIGMVLDDPGRLLGLHYFAPAEACPTVEVISTSATREQVRGRALDFLIRTGKSPLPCKDSPGFAVNRFLCPYCNEAVRIVDEGLATPGQIDAVARDLFEVPAGPFQVMNLTKPVIMLHAMQGLERLGARYRPAAGLLKIGQDKVDWSIDEDLPLLPDVTRRIIAGRLTDALCRPAMEALAEGVASAEDMDRGAREALRLGRTPIAILDGMSEAERERTWTGGRA